jgi:hypothetical protein
MEAAMALTHSKEAFQTLSLALLATIAGYVTLALTSTLVQEVWLGGVRYQQSTPTVLILAGLFTPLCALLGGFISALIAGRARWLAAATLSALITAETTYLYSTRRVDGPLWFEACAAAALILAVLVGTWAGARYRETRHRSRA